MSPEMSGWGPLLSRLAVEALLLVALAALAGRWVATVQWQRLLWQSVFVALALVWGVELSGGRGWIPSWLQDRPLSPTPHTMTAQVESGILDRGSETADLAPRDETSGSALPVKPSWWPGLVWSLGLGGFLLRSMSHRVRLIWRIRTVHRTSDLRASKRSAEAIDRIRNTIGLGPVDLRVLQGLRGPAAFGILRPTVAVPEDFEERFSAVQQEAMLAHELGHLAQRDPVWLLLVDLVCAVAWWHPLVWWARRQFRAACEAAADDVSTLVPGGRIALAEALVEFGRALTAHGGVGVGGSGLRSDLARRVTALVEQPGELQTIQRRSRWMFHIGLTLLMVAWLQIPFSGSQEGIGTLIATAWAESTVNVTADKRDAAPSVTPPAQEAGQAITGSPSTAPVPTEAGSGTAPMPTASGKSGTQVLMSVFLVTILERGPTDIGLDWLFGQTVTNNPPLVSAMAKRVPGGDGTLKGDRLRVDRLTVEGQVAVLSRDQFTALKARFDQHGGVDFLSAPKVTTLSGRPASVSISDVMTMVTGVDARDASSTNQAEIRYRTDQVSQGVSVDLVPTAQVDGWRVTVLASVTEFLGYDAPKETDRITAKAGNGKPIAAVVPLPRLQVLETRANATTQSGGVIALRGPMTERVIQYKDKVPVFGNIPLIGRLFRKEGRQTQRNRLYVFVQPETIDAEGNTTPKP